MFPKYATKLKSAKQTAGIKGRTGIGLEWIELVLDWNGLDWSGMDEAKWIGLEWIGLDCNGLEWIGLEWIGTDGRKQNGLDWCKTGAKHRTTWFLFDSTKTKTFSIAIVIQKS